MRSHRLAAAGALALATPSPADVKLYGRKDEELSPSELAREFRGVKTSLEKQHREVQDWIAKAGQSIKETGEIAADVKSGLEKASKQGEELAAKFAELEQLVAKFTANDNGQRQAQKSLGQLVTEDEKVKSFLENGGGKVRSS